MKRLPLLPLAFALLIGLAGCGGGGEPPDSPSAPDAGVPPGSTEVGPFVIHTAGVAGVVAKTLPHQSGATFTALYGDTIDYVGVQELLDRIVFSSFRTPSDWDIWVCDLFGENLHRVNGTGHPDRHPAWSPDGRRIAFGQERDGAGQADVYVMDANGANLTNITNSTNYDTHPSWSPSGDRLAFETNRWASNFEIGVMYTDGSGAVNLTSHPSNDYQPDWSPDRTMGGIAFCSVRDGSAEIYRMSPDGSDQTRVTDIAAQAQRPVWSPEGYFIAFTSSNTSVVPNLSDILEVNSDGLDQGALADSSHYEDEPSYSRDRRFLAYCSAEGGGFNIWVRQLDPPYTRVRVTDGGGSDGYPDLGSPTVQTARVLIGRNGADHGFNPIHNQAIAVVAAFDGEGYLNFIRLGVPSYNVASLNVTPLADTGQHLVGALWSVPDMYYIEEDAGLGQSPTLWDLSGVTSRSIILYLNANTGKLVSVLDLDDSVATASEHAAATVTHQVSGGSTTVRGDFRAVYGADGELVAEGDIGAVQIDVANRTVRAF